MMKDCFSYEKIDEVAILTFDMPNQSVNVLNDESMASFAHLIKEIENDSSIKAVIIISGKKNNFVAGADLHQLSKSKSPQDAEKLCASLQQIFNDVEQSQKIYIAAINGICVGGGLELALSCHYRMASLDNTQFAFPEVSLGIIPAAGGTQRLPPLVGIKESLDLLLTGKKISSQKAFRIGLLDKAVDLFEELRPSSIAYAKKLIKNRVPSKKNWLFSLLPWLCFPYLWLAQKRVEKKTQGLFDAPIIIIKAIINGIKHGKEAGLLFERQNFGKLLHSAISQNLIYLFLAQQKRRKNPFGENEFFGNRIGILGSGLMGSGIAYVSLKNEFDVYLFDKDQKALSRAESFISKELQKDYLQKHAPALASKRAMSKLALGTHKEQLFECNLIIEAVFEDLSIKQKLLKELEPHLKDDAIFASNTSSIPLADISAESAIKDRIVGMHYFSPVPKVPLLEIVRTKDTSDDTLKKACSVGLKQGKTLIVVNDKAGFYTTRIIAALFDEVSILLAQGYNPKTIDLELKKLGFPIGPVALMDEIGLDVGLHVSTILFDHFGSRLIAADLTMMQRMIEHNFLGHKTKKGFYLHDDHRQKINKEAFNLLALPKEPVQDMPFSCGDRMLFRMVNEAAFCLSEEVIANKEDGDVGAVYGVGFPAHLGGPFRYSEHRGIHAVAHDLNALHDLYGERFLMAPFFSTDTTG